jgi:two-component system LytT family response regulator
MLKSVIIDDELKSREILKKMLLNHCGKITEVSATCQNVDEGLEAIKEHQPDIVFLDVHMQGETGFDLLERINNIDFEVIFTTAHSEYALKAIKFSAIDYLLKPVDITGLQNAVAKVKNRQDKSGNNKFKQLLHNLKADHFRLALPTSEGLTFIKVDDILYFKASGNYTEIHMAQGEKYLVSRQLKEYDDLLVDSNFFRIHHSFLINLNHIKNYIKGDGGYVVMADKISIDVSRRKKEAFLERIGYKP